MKLFTVASTFVRRAAAGVLLFGALPGAFADVVLDWNIAMTHFSEIQPPPGIPPFVEARIYAMTHIAILDAIEEAKGSSHHSWKHRGPASPEAAAAQAAHDVLVNQFPGGASAFNTLLATQLAAIPNGSAKSKGIALGADSAADILANRAHDGAATPTGPYTPGTKPGAYRPTPPFDGPPFNGFVDAVNWGKVKPFALRNGRQFRSPPPYKVTDLDYTFDVNEIKVLGSIDSVARTEDQTNLALFWYENSSFAWNRIARVIDAPHPRNLVEHAQLFAALNIAIADAYIASTESKFTYNFWRPITAIRLAATDGNDQTSPDAGWEPLMLTPPIPDFPSAHAAAGGAASVVLIEFFGDHQTFTFSSTMAAPFPSATPRTFHRISDAAKENAFSRMLVGIHFRLACEVGYEQGIDVGSWVVRHSRSGCDR